MRRLAHIGCTLAAIGFLAVALSCGVGTVAVHQRVVAPPRLEVQAMGYRVVAYPLWIRSNPPRYFYSVWLFSTFYPARMGGRPVEQGQQILLLPLRAD